MRKSGVAGMYVRVIEKMYEDNKPAVKFAVGVPDGFKVEIAQAGCCGL